MGWAVEMASRPIPFMETFMADRASASIIIGGAIPRNLIPTLIKEIEYDHGRSDWDGEPIEAESIGSGGPLTIYAHELPGGIFQSVEGFCQKHRLPFLRLSDGCVGVFGPERVVYRAEEKSEHFEVNEAGEVVVTMRELLTLGSIEQAVAWFNAADFTPPSLTIDDDLSTTCDQVRDDG